MTTGALLVLTLSFSLAPRSVRAQPESVPVAPTGPASVVRRLSSPATVERPPLAVSLRRLTLVEQPEQPIDPAHAMATNPPPTTGEPPGITQRWWFWAAMGAVAVGAAVFLVAATRQSEAPQTRLGNMEAFR